MTSKEFLNNMCNKCEMQMLKNKKLCPWRSISNDYCDEYENIKQDLDKLEELEEQVATLDNSLNNLALDLDIAREENNKLKNVIESLNESLDFEVDLENYNLNTCLGTIAFINIDSDTMKELKLLKEVLDCLKINIKN